MSTAAGGEGAAREIPVGRLAAFEDEPSLPSLSLPPRPHRRTRAESDPASTDESAAATSDRPTKADELNPARPRTRRGLKASNVHIPVRVLGAVEQTKSSTRMSNGDVIITAIEDTYEELKTLISPRRVTGGTLFGQRASRPSRTPSAEPVTPLNYRLTPEDYEVLDRLVDELGATSRSHLISVALSAYYDKQHPSN